MFNMTPFQSWTLMILLFALVAAFVWLLKLVEEQRVERDRAAASAADQALTADEPLAVVTELRAAKRERHLALVPEPKPSPEIYDWARTGL